jgi:hypothetical protein
MKRGISNKLTKRQKNRIRNTRKKIKGGMPDDNIIKNAEINNPIKYTYKMQALLNSNNISDDEKTQIIKKLFSKILRMLNFKEVSGRLSDIQYIIARKQKHRACKGKTSNDESCQKAKAIVDTIKRNNKNLTMYKRFTLRHKTISGLSMKILNRILTSSIDYYEKASEDTKGMIKDVLQMYFTSETINLKKYILEADDLTTDEINKLKELEENKPSPQQLKNAEETIFDSSDSEKKEMLDSSDSEKVMKEDNVSPYNYKTFIEIIGKDINTISEEEFNAIIEIDISGGKIMGGAPFGYVLGIIGVVLLFVFLLGCGMATSGVCLAVLVIMLICFVYGALIARA